MKLPHLLFVYNADGDIFSTVTDFAHKIISPKTYNCSLCTLTYGSFSMKQEWKDFLTQLSAEKTFLHKNEFQTQYDSTAALPAVFFLQENVPIELLSASEIDACNNLKELEDLLIKRLRIYFPADEHR